MTLEATDQSPTELATPTPSVKASPGIYRRVIDLAWPTIAQNLLEMLLGVIDTILVARLGTAAIAGVGTALQVLYFLIAILSAVTVGASIMVAHAIGAAQPRIANNTAKQAIIWGLLSSLPAALVGVLGAGLLIRAFGVAADVAEIGTTYLQIMMFSLPTLMLIFIAGAVLRGAGDTRTPMLVGLLDNLINAVLAYALIYGHLGLPALGAAGSAWAAAIARLVGAVILIAVLVRGRGGLRLRGWHGWRPQLAPVRQVFRLGIPAAIEQMLISASFTVFTVIIARLGTIDLAAQRISFNILSLGFMPGVGFGIATSVLVGQSLGAGHKALAREAAHAAAIWVTGWMTVMGIIFFVFAHPIATIFTTDPEVIDLSAACLRVLVFSLPIWGQTFIWSGGLRGTGNTRLPLLANTVGMWLGVALAFVLIRLTQPTLPLVWAVCLPGWLLSAVIVWIGFRRAKLAALTTDNSAALAAH